MRIPFSRMSLLALVSTASTSFALVACSAAESPGVPDSTVTDSSISDAARIDSNTVTDSGPRDSSSSDASQVAPTTAEEIRAWLATGAYRNWNCEAAPHARRGNSPHPINRICTNNALSQADLNAPLPIGSAAVKEGYDNNGNINMYYVDVKVAEGDESAPESVLYWQGTLSAVGISGLGSSSQTGFCYGCHTGAPSTGAEQFYTIVR